MLILIGKPMLCYQIGQQMLCYQMHNVTSTDNQTSPVIRSGTASLICTATDTLYVAQMSTIFKLCAWLLITQAWVVMLCFKFESWIVVADEQCVTDGPH